MDRPEEILLDLNQSRNARIQAAFKLGSRGSSQDLDILIKALFNDPSPCVRHECAFSLGETAARKIVPDLIKVLESDANAFVVHEAALALGTIGDMRALEPLEKLKTSQNLDIIESAEIAIERLLS